MARFRIHWEYENGGEDSIEIEGDDIESLRLQATEAVASRNGINPWSEELRD